MFSRMEEKAFFQINASQQSFELMAKTLSHLKMIETTRTFHVCVPCSHFQHLSVLEVAFIQKGVEFARSSMNYSNRRYLLLIF